MLVTISLPPSENKHQQIVNKFWSSVMDDSRAGHRHTPITILLAAILGKNAGTDIITTSQK